MTAIDSSADLSRIPAGKELFDLYVHQKDRAEHSLSVERDITIKNYLAFGAVLLLQTGFYTSVLKSHVIIMISGFVIIVISLIARAMSIFYAKYTLELFAVARIYRKAYLRGQNGLKVIEKRKELYAEENGVRKTIGNSNTLSRREFLRGYGVLSQINTFPAFVGFLMLGIGFIAWSKDPGPIWDVLKSP
jgi:hypothetical protein